MASNPFLLSLRTALKPAASFQAVPYKGGGQSLECSTEPVHQGIMSQAELLNLVASMDASLLPCLPARELQAADRSFLLSNPVDVERHVREFMDAAKKLQLFFVRVQHQYQPSREEVLTKEIAALEAELKAKAELIDRQQALLQEWQAALKAQRDAIVKELERV